MPPELIPGETKEQYVARRNRELLAEREQRKIDLREGRIDVVFEVDDFGFLTPGFDDLLRLKKSFPGLKVTCFTVPIPKAFYSQENSRHFSWGKYEKWAKMVNSLGWVEIAVHGFSHTHFECDCDYGKAIETIRAAENTLRRVGLRYVKIWRAPYWQYSYDFLNALKDEGWVAAVNRNRPAPLPVGLGTYEFNWSIEEPIIFGGTVCAHSHFFGNNANNINDCLGNILKVLPTTAKFITLSEYVEKKSVEDAARRGKGA